MAVIFQVDISAEGIFVVVLQLVVIVTPIEPMSIYLWVYRFITIGFQSIKLLVSVSLWHCFYNKKAWIKLQSDIWPCNVLLLIILNTLSC